MRRTIRLLLLTLPVAAGCAGSRVVMTTRPLAPKNPVRLIATVSTAGDFSAKLAEELARLGYSNLDQSRTRSLLEKLDLENEDFASSRMLAELKNRRVDALMKVDVSMTAASAEKLDNVRVGVTSTVDGEQLSGFTWTNSWGGAVGSPADNAMRLSVADAARAIALEVSKQIGPPGPKTSVMMDDLIAAKKALLGGGAPVAPAPPAFTSDIDVPARKSAERPDDFALVIGIEEYQNVPKADYGARDAKAVRAHLEALGFPSRNIVSLIGSEATSSKLKSYLEEWLPLNVKPASTLFVYYSGHGAPDVKSGDAYLVPWDGDPKFLKSSALPLTQVYADLAKTKARRVIVALDACFSGAGGRSVLAKGARPLIAKIADTAPTSGNLTVLAAASGDEITGSLDEQGHGMFTYYLLKGLEADPKASAKSLFGYLAPKVKEEARRQNREQSPVLAGASLTEPLLAP